MSKESRLQGWNTNQVQSLEGLHKILTTEFKCLELLLPNFLSRVAEQSSLPPTVFLCLSDAHFAHIIMSSWLQKQKKLCVALNCQSKEPELEMIHAECSRSIIDSISAGNFQVRTCPKSHSFQLINIIIAHLPLSGLSDVKGVQLLKV